MCTPGSTSRCLRFCVPSRYDELTPIPTDITNHDGRRADGEWHQCIIDDKVYLRAPAYDESGDVVLGQYGIERENQEEHYSELFQRGSQALYFAKCRNQNETWVPLLEK